MGTSHEGSETELSVVVVPLLSRFLSPLNMLIGGTVVVLVFLGFVWMSHNKDILRKMKKQYPTTFVVAIMLSSYFLISYLGDVMVFMFGITLPLLCEYLFSSLTRWSCVTWAFSNKSAQSKSVVNFAICVKMVPKQNWGRGHKGAQAIFNVIIKWAPVVT